MKLEIVAYADLVGGVGADQGPAAERRILEVLACHPTANPIAIVRPGMPDRYDRAARTHTK